MTLAWAAPLVLLVGTLLLSAVHQSVAGEFLRTHVDEFGLQGTRLQLAFLLALLAGLGGLCLVMLGNPRGRLVHDCDAIPRTPKVVAAFLAVCVLPLLHSDEWFVLGFVTTLLVTMAGARGLGSSVGLVMTRARTVALVSLWTLVGAYVWIFFVVPLRDGPVTILSPTAVSSHYAMTVLPGFDAASGHLMERSNYGLLMPVLIAFALKILTLTVHAGGGLLVSVGAYQLVALALLLATTFLLDRTSFAWTSALIILLTPSLSLLRLETPNQLGIRYIPFIVGILLLVSVSRATRGPGDAIALAMASGVLLVLSPEIGFAVSCGYGWYLVLIGYRRDRPVRSIVSAVGRFAIPALLMYGLLASFAARGIYAESPDGQLSFAALFASGYGGIVTEWNTQAALVMLFASAALVRSATDVVSGCAARSDVLRGAMAAMMLGWLPYYVNRMAAANLWFEFVLLVLLWAPTLRGAMGRFSRGEDPEALPYGVLAVALIGGLVASNVVTGGLEIAAVRSRADNCRPIDQLVARSCLPSRDAEAVRGHLGLISGIQDRSDYLVLSHYPAEVRLLGFNRDFPWYEPFGEVARPVDQEQVVSWIDGRGPRYLLVEDPSSELSRSLPQRTTHQRNLVAQLRHYRFRRSAAGWLIYERN